MGSTQSNTPRAEKVSQSPVDPKAEELDHVLSESEPESDSADSVNPEPNPNLTGLVSGMALFGVYLLGLLFIRDEMGISPVVTTLIGGTMVLLYNETNRMMTYKFIRQFIVTDAEIKSENSLMIVKWIPDTPEDTENPFTLESVTENLVNLIHSNKHKGQLHLRYRDSETRTLYLNA